MKTIVAAAFLLALASCKPNPALIGAKTGEAVGSSKSAPTAGASAGAAAGEATGPRLFWKK